MKILYANTLDYDYMLQQRPQHILNLLAERGHEVFWVNKTQQTGKIPDRYGNLKVFHNWEIFKKRYVNKMDILFCAWSVRHTDIDEINPKMVIFDNVDNFKDWESTDSIMCQKSDLILTTSKLLNIDKMRDFPDKKILMCPNGCHSRFGVESDDYNIQEPVEFKETTKPKLLFSGALAYWCDLDLITTLTKKYDIHVVGVPWGIEKHQSLLHKIKYVGKKSYTELQAYYKYCDLNLLPFDVKNPIATYSNPIKMFEPAVYGKQTVSTNIPDALGNSPAVLTADSKLKFIKNIEQVLSNKNNKKIQQQCLEFAKENDWNKRVDIIEQGIDTFFAERG